MADKRSKVGSIWQWDLLGSLSAGRQWAVGCFVFISTELNAQKLLELRNSKWGNIFKRHLLQAAKEMLLSVWSLWAGQRGSTPSMLSIHISKGKSFNTFLVSSHFNICALHFHCSFCSITKKEKKREEVDFPCDLWIKTLWSKSLTAFVAN